MKRKLKPVDRATLARFKREKRCFDQGHNDRLSLYATEVSRMSERIAFLESELKALRENTVDKALLEEHEKTAFHKGLHEGQSGKEEEFKNEKRCFNKMHGFVDGKTLMNLNFGDVVSLFAKLSSDPMSGGIMARITVLVPFGVNINRMTEVQSIKFAKDFVSSIKIEEKKGDA